MKDKQRNGEGLAGAGMGSPTEPKAAGQPVHPVDEVDRVGDEQDPKQRRRQGPVGQDDLIAEGMGQGRDAKAEIV